jgi:Protein of unknown function (DUF429)
VKRAFHKFIGLDLGGVRGKTTAIAEISVGNHGSGWSALVTKVALRAGDQPWTDETLAGYLVAMDPVTTAIAVDAPLTAHACGRCVRPACPGALACEDPAVVWLRSGQRVELSDQSSSVRSASLSSTGSSSASSRSLMTTVQSGESRARLTPYSHRATEVSLVAKGLWPVSRLGGANSPIAARARHLARRLSSSGWQLHRNLLEVSPQATVTALFGARAARGRKRDADPWHTRAEILTRLHDLSFAPSSRLAREEVLRNDHCFDAVVSAYTAYCWARDGWELPEQGAEVFATDGWVWAPPESAKR